MKDSAQKILNHIDSAQNIIGAAMTASLVGDNQAVFRCLEQAMKDLHEVILTLERLPKKIKKCCSVRDDRVE